MAGTWVANEAALLPQAFDETVLAYDGNSVLITPAIQLGTVATFRDTGSTGYGSALFKYVRYSGGGGGDAVVDGTAGSVVYNTDTPNLVTMDVNSTSAGGAPVSSSVAGYLHTSPSGTSNATATNQWIQITGLALYNSAIAVGTAMKISAANGTLVIATTNDIVPHSAVQISGTGATAVICLDCVH